MNRLLAFAALALSASAASAQSGAVRSPVQQARANVATAARSAPKDSVKTDSAASTTARAGALPADDPSLTITREVFSYDGGGRRDPFFSLMLTSELRPTINDLYVSLITHSEDGRGSVAFLIDRTTKDEYRAKIGDKIGRLRVAAIHPKSIVFDVDEFGFQRRETLVLGDSTKVRR